MRRFLFLPLVFTFLILNSSQVYAQSVPPRATFVPVSESLDSAEATSSAEASPTPTPTPEPTPRADITKTTEETIGRLEQVLREQAIGPAFPFNPLKHAIRATIDAGVAPNTIVLLLLLPLVVAIIAGARHIIGLRGFGIFLPASLAIVFVATGPVIGIGLFMTIVLVSTLARLLLRGYLPHVAGAPFGLPSVHR